MRKICYAAIAASIASLSGGSALAGDAVSEWASIKIPPAPQLKPATVDRKTTALLIADLGKNCLNRPRCAATVPAVKRLHDAARAADAMVVYTLAGTNPTADEIVDPGIRPKDGEWIAQRGPDKFIGSSLDERLKAKGIRTVIIVGTAAQGVVFGTGSSAAQRGYTVVVPVDGMSSDDAFGELYTAWHFSSGATAVVLEKITLTRIEMINFSN
jgi:nicotinamidase-related amidase